MGLTLFNKILLNHLVQKRNNGDCLLYIDRHYLHEVTSPQAFEGLKIAGRKPWRLNSNLATADHSIPTKNRKLGMASIDDPTALIQVQTLDQNCSELGILEYKLDDNEQGIVHIIGGELGATLPGMTIVCGDSHTSTHGAFATIAMGIGTSEVEHVLATQCMWVKPFKNMLVLFDGKLPKGVYAKDMILSLIGRIGTAGATGHAIEYAGSSISCLSMEERMTICNMSIEAGARVGLIAVDETTIDYLATKKFAPKGEELKQAKNYWRTLHSDKDAKFDRQIKIDTSQLQPQVSWGTSPEMVVDVNATIPNPQQASTETNRTAWKKALNYMGLKPNTAICDIKLDKIFIGSCTNARIEDLRIAASIVKGKKLASNIKQALVVPGSGNVKRSAETEGLDKIFTQAGFEWRSPGCSMCLGMNADKLANNERCASTSNRNFEGRQGAGGRTHLVSPAMAAAAAVHGHFVDVRQLIN